MKWQFLKRVFIIIVLSAALYSFLLSFVFYVKKDPPIYHNRDAIERLKINEGEHFGFIVFGDNHAGLFFNDNAFIKLLASMNREDRYRGKHWFKLPIDFVLIAGDVTYRGSEWDFRIFNKERSMLKWPVVTAMGNHDDDQDNGELFEKYVGKRNFSFVNRNSYFIVIDDSTNELSDEQMVWFEEELKKSQNFPNRFVCLHKSPMSAHQLSWFRGETALWSYPFMKLCEKYKVDMVFAGHEHLFKEMNFGGVKYIVTGGGSTLPTVPDWEGGFLNYIVVRVKGDYVDYEVRKITPPFWQLVTAYLFKDVFFAIKGALF